MAAAALMLLPAAAAQGPTATGTGSGTIYAIDGRVLCPEVPFTFEVALVPGGRAVLGYQWVGGGGCPLTTGGGLLLGTVGWDLQGSPPVTVTFGCAGDAEAGLSCGTASTGASLSPFAELGGAVELRVWGGASRFEGRGVVV